MFKKTLMWSVVALVAIQFIPVEKKNPKVDESLALKAPKEVMKILKTSCYDCHSFETKWPAYADIAPISFFVASHVQDARDALNFSEYKKIDPEIKKARLKRAIMTVRNSMMPLSSYLMIHKEAKLSKDEKIVLEKWFTSELNKMD